jgi:hypothetical protein
MSTVFPKGKICYYRHDEPVRSHLPVFAPRGMLAYRRIILELRCCEDIPAGTVGRVEPTTAVVGPPDMPLVPFGFEIDTSLISGWSPEEAGAADVPVNRWSKVFYPESAEHSKPEWAPEAMASLKLTKRQLGLLAYAAQLSMVLSHKADSYLSRNAETGAFAIGELSVQSPKHLELQQLVDVIVNQFNASFPQEKVCTSNSSTP